MKQYNSTHLTECLLSRLITVRNLYRCPAATAVSGEVARLEMMESYVLITPAKNEEDTIEKTIRSVLAQTMLPKKWVIVNDGSTDKTGDIVGKYEKKYDFITLHNRTSTRERHFGSKARAFAEGYALLGKINYDLIGNIDADITFDSNYFERIIDQFTRDPELGLAGGNIKELIDGDFVLQKISYNSVAGAVQLFRRQCFEDVGGYLPLRYGGIDAAAEVMARMHGWKVRTITDISVLHHGRILTGNSNILGTRFKKGMTNRSLGYHPIYQMFVSIYRFGDKPYVIGGITMFFGYLWALLKRNSTQVPKDVVKFLRKEQMARIRAMIKRTAGSLFRKKAQMETREASSWISSG